MAGSKSEVIMNRNTPARHTLITTLQARILSAILALAILAPIIANDIPLYVKRHGQHHFPVLSSLAPGLFPTPQGVNWQNPGAWGDQYIMPPIPYHAKTVDLKNAAYTSPLQAQDLSHWSRRHWLGTDDLGRDVLAGLLHGSSISLSIGILASLLALIIGIAVGGTAGYFGDDQYRPRRATVASGLITIATAIATGAAWFQIGALGLLHFAALIALATMAHCALSYALKKIPLMRKRLRFPLDLITLRIIETIRSVPDLFLIIGIAAVIRQTGIAELILIIGFLRWPVIARYIRAEMLKVRNQDYIWYARGTGLPPAKVFLGHALPNALTPVWVLAAFSVALAILVESSLSFLGIGIPADWVTWGSMLNNSRRSLDAWHMAVFPGIAMFAVIYFFNYLGEQMEQKLRAGR